MGCRILVGSEGEGRQQAVLFDSVTGWAFGPLFDDTGHVGAFSAAACFEDWLGVDPRSVPAADLEAKYGAWLEARGDDEAACGICDGSGGMS